MKKDAKALDALTRDVAEKIAKEMRENDPEKEKAFELDQARRDEELTKRLKEHIAKRKK